MWGQRRRRWPYIGSTHVNSTKCHIWNCHSSLAYGPTMSFWKMILSDYNGTLANLSESWDSNGASSLAMNIQQPSTGLSGGVLVNLKLWASTPPPPPTAPEASSTDIHWHRQVQSNHIKRQPKRRSANVGQCRRRWTNIKTAFGKCRFYVGPASQTLAWHQNNIGSMSPVCWDIFFVFLFMRSMC